MTDQAEPAREKPAEMGDAISFYGQLISVVMPHLGEREQGLLVDYTIVEAILAMPEMQAVAKLLRSLPTTQDGWALALAIEALPQSVLDWAQVIDADGDPIVGRQT